MKGVGFVCETNKQNKQTGQPRPYRMRAASVLRTIDDDGQLLKEHLMLNLQPSGPEGRRPQPWRRTAIPDRAPGAPCRAEAAPLGHQQPQAKPLGF